MSLENHRHAGNVEKFFNLPYAHVMLGKLVGTVDVTRKIGWPGMNLNNFNYLVVLG